jgi:hypothetical protein
MVKRRRKEKNVKAQEEPADGTDQNGKWMPTRLLIRH